MALLNLGLGYAAALALVEPPLWSGLRLPRPSLHWRFRRRKADGTAEQPAQAATPAAALAAADLGSEAAAAPPIVAGLDELPPDWLAQLAAQGIVAETFVEATAHIVRLEIGRYREQLVAGESLARQLALTGDAGGLARLADWLRALHQDWLDMQTSAADLLGQRAGRHGDHEQAAAWLEQSLLDQAVQIRTACEAVAGVARAGDADQQAKLLIEQTTTVLAQTHALRDRVIDLLATLMRAGREILNCPEVVQRDLLTGLPNRIGLEKLLLGWWSGDEQRTRLLSAVLIDIDRFGRINQRLGTRAGDRALVAIGRIIDESLAKDRGFERLARASGQAWMILLGDTGPHQALSAAERLRQTIEATTLKDQTVEFDLTVSCGVIEVGPTESSIDLVQRAEGALRYAKKAGRNRCALDKGDGPAMIEPPQFPVKGRVVSLDEIVLPNSQTPGA
jgi:diguanylate cyclase (GGDEF)-like protein